jgi:pimeloyl-ACP methyl ester carboxylesterase
MLVETASNPWLRRLTGEERVFAAALAVIALYSASLALRSSAGAVVDLLLAGGAVALSAALFVLFLHRGRVVRTVLAAALGLAASSVGLALHLPRLVFGRADAGDVIGVLVAVAGLVLLGLALRVALRAHRRRVQLLAIPVCLVLLQWVVVPVMNAGLVVNVPRQEIPSVGSLGVRGVREVTFAARDGVRLSAWYAPGRRGAAVILVHGSHGTREDTADHMRSLARAGYAVLAVDARGHGDSAGQTNALGWQGADDLAGAVEYLRIRARIHARRIAALGLSMGGEEALRAAATGVPLGAVIADGAGASTSGDSRLTSSGAVPRSVSWVTMRAVELFAGEREPRPLKEIVGRIDVPVLLIASNADGELAIDRVYRERIGPTGELWHVPDAGHTKALETHRSEYAARITAFLEQGLRR